MIRSALLYALFERRICVDAFGRGNGCWHVAHSSINSTSNVVSVGVGHDISFEIELRERYGCSILILDPTPTGVRTIAQLSPLPEGLKFIKMGLAGRDGDIAFADPSSAEEGSFRRVAGAELHASQLFPCMRLPTLMQSERLKRVDLLKLDIEGFEYEVLRDLCASHCGVSQICVEFHHGLVPGVSRMDTLAAMFRLRRAGYQLIDHDGLNHTFVRVQRAA